MKYIVKILGCLGDEKWHVKEEFYTLIRATYGRDDKYLEKYSNIEEHFKKYINYGFVIKGKAENLKIKGTMLEMRGHDSFKISPKGLLALDYYRALFGGKDLDLGDLFKQNNKFT